MTTLVADVCGKIDEQARRAGQVIDNLRKFIKKQDDRAPSRSTSTAWSSDVLSLIEADAHSEGIRVFVEYGRRPCASSAPMRCSYSRCC